MRAEAEGAVKLRNASECFPFVSYGYIFLHTVLQLHTFAFSGSEDQLIDCKTSVSRFSLEHEAEVGGGADLHLAGRPFRTSSV